MNVNLFKIISTVRTCSRLWVWACCPCWRWRPLRQSCPKGSAKEAVCGRGRCRGVLADVGAAFSVRCTYIGPDAGGQRGRGLFNMVIWAFITDVIDYQEVRTGSRDDGTVYAVHRLRASWAGGAGRRGRLCTGGHRLREQHGPCGADAACTARAFTPFPPLVPGLELIWRSLVLLLAHPLTKSVEENAPCCANGAAKRYRSRSGPGWRTPAPAYDTAFRPVFQDTYISSEREGKTYGNTSVPINEGWALSAQERPRQPFLPALPPRGPAPPLETHWTARTAAATTGAAHAAISRPLRSRRAKHVYVEVEAASQRKARSSSTVWRKASHKGGYSPFRANVTDALHSTAEEPAGHLGGDNTQRDDV